MSRHASLQRLARAAADNDAVAEERGVPAALAELELEAADVQHVAEQRALRAVVLERPNGARELAAVHASGATRPQGFALTQDERRRLTLYAAIYMDGIALGVRAERAELETLRRLATALHERVEMDESVGVCLTDRAAALELGAYLAKKGGA